MRRKVRSKGAQKKEREREGGGGGGGGRERYEPIKSKIHMTEQILSLGPIDLLLSLQLTPTTFHIKVEHFPNNLMLQKLEGTRREKGKKSV